jgi:DNA excision repair protein ERCC-3
VNRYIDWLYTLPPEVKQELGFKEPPFKPVIEGDFLLCKPEETDFAWQRYKRYLTRREAPGKIRIKRRSHFWLVCELIKDGILPFKPKPVDPEDLLERYPRFELKDFQKEAWTYFTRFGNIGVYWPPGVGKMFFAIYALTRMKGKKLVVVPTVTLVEEWTRKIEALTPLNPWEYEVICYASAHRVMNREYILTVFDEHQHLPANTYARLALIKTKYRIGTTATPWREDGRIDLIFALTGFPLGLSWEEFLKMKVIAKPYIELIMVPNITQKFSILNELIRKHQEKTMILCDSINLGKRISSKFGIPFVYGATARRLQIIERNPVTVVSRVGDEGIDITDLKTIIEFDFLFGSRRQEAQRMGRLLHSRFKGEHYILMTSEEFERYKKRLYSLYERGFQIKITRRD